MRDRAGLFVMHSESPISRPETFSCIQKTLGAVFKSVVPLYTYIQMYAVLWSVTVAGDGTDISKCKPANLDKKLKKLGIGNLKLYNGLTHAAMQISYPYINEILSKPSRIITDKNPEFPDNFL